MYCGWFKMILINFNFDPFGIGNRVTDPIFKFMGTVRRHRKKNKRF